MTNRERLERAIEKGDARAVLVKPNQIGPITRAIDVVHAARDVGIETVVSPHSGETCDTTIADLAASLDAGQIKIGSLARSERLAKYNRLLEFEREGALATRDPLCPETSGGPARFAGNPVGSLTTGGVAEMA